MEHSHKFFSNIACKYFPCHEMPDSEEFNCLFCFCPLYFLGESCGGDFKYSEWGAKACVDCGLPHCPDYYNIIVSKLKEAKI